MPVFYPPVLIPWSALGVYDGSVYEALMECALSDPLNRTDVIQSYAVSTFAYHFVFARLIIHACLQEYVKPILERGRRLAAQGGAKL